MCPSISVRVEMISGHELEEHAFRPCATEANMTVMQAIDSYKTFPDISSLQPTTYTFNKIK